METKALSRRRKLLYTMDMIGGQAVAQTKNLWLLFFLAPPQDEGLPARIPGLGLGPWDIDPRLLAGALLTIGRIVEALDDPLIGFWSDRTRSRWGRRVPFILLATPFYGLFFALMWLSPASGASVANAVFVFIVLQLFYAASTLSGQPYEALIPEMAKTHRERMSVVAWQFYFGILGAVLGLVVSGVLKDAFGFMVMGAVIAVAGVAFRYGGLAGIWRLGRSAPSSSRESFGRAIKLTMTNKQFLYFLPTFVLFQLSTTMVIAWLPFFVKEILEAENEGAITSVLTGVALVSMLLSVRLLWPLANRRGKRWVYLVCLLGTALVTPLLAVAGFVPGIPKLAQGIVMAALVGLPMAGVNLLPRAITADITDYDALRTGARREATFYAVQNLFEKAGSSFAPLLLAAILLLGDTQDDPLGIRLVGPVAGVIAAFGFLVFRHYRLSDKVTAETVRALEAR